METVVTVIIIVIIIFIFYCGVEELVKPTPKVKSKEEIYEEAIASITDEQLESKIRSHTEGGYNKMMNILRGTLTGTELEPLLSSHIWIPSEATLVCMADKGKLPWHFASFGMRAGGRGGGTRYDPKEQEEAEAKCAMMLFANKKLKEHGVVYPIMINRTDRKHQFGEDFLCELGSLGADIYSRYNYVWSGANMSYRGSVYDRFKAK